MTTSWPLALAGASVLVLTIGAVHTGRHGRRWSLEALSLLAALARVPTPAVLTRLLGALPATQCTRTVFARPGLGEAALGRARAGALVLASTPAVVAAAFAPAVIPILLVAPVAALGVLDAVSVRATRQRERQLLDQLPDALDLLAVSARAGMTLDAAIGLVAERFGGAFREEIDTVRRAVELGPVAALPSRPLPIEPHPSRWSSCAARSFVPMSSVRPSRERSSASREACATLEVRRLGNVPPRPPPRSSSWSHC
jgi:Flp pilus assembly protein TadB